MSIHLYNLFIFEFIFHIPFSFNIVWINFVIRYFFMNIHPQWDQHHQKEWIVDNNPSYKLFQTLFEFLSVQALQIFKKILKELHLNYLFQIYLYIVFTSCMTGRVVPYVIDATNRIKGDIATRAVGVARWW